jgi:hypothetical protein
MRGRTAVAILAAIAVQMSCGRAPSMRSNADLRTGALRGANLLLVTIDTLRADRVGASAGVPLTPTLDALAARGVRFTQAHAHAPLTLPAHTSIMTGLIPPTHGVHNNGSTALEPRCRHWRRSSATPAIGPGHSSVRSCSMPVSA